MYLPAEFSASAILYIYTGDSGLVEITECSESGLNFTLNKTLNINSGYTFLAACKDNDGTCVSENLSGTDDILIYIKCLLLVTAG